MSKHRNKAMTQHRPHPTGRWLLGALVMGALGAAAVYYTTGPRGSGEPAIPAGVQLSSWYDNGHDGRYVLQVADGHAPSAGERVAGIVRSDSNCTPDAQGLSHCHNAIELANGEQITVIDTHQISRNPCLKAGGKITLTGIGSSWITGTLVGA
ncbi:MAG TPA: hypothetical protein VMV91_10885 [Rhodocyclaceae bacterium]|nr:hypothetical protein [Rhodocyclaceae bacterium]